MDLTGYYNLISSEGMARRYLLGKCFKNHQRFCPRCRQRKLYKLCDGRYRCSRCDYTFHDFSGRWINHGRLSCIQWLSILKLFELEVSVHKMARQMKMSYKAVYGAMNTIRMSILSHAVNADALLGGEIGLYEAHFGRRRKGNSGSGDAVKVPVFGILERDGRVQVNVVPNVTAETVLGLPIKKVHRGSVVYTEKFRGYDNLIFCGNWRLKLDSGKHFSSGWVYIDDIDRFWGWTKKHFIKHRSFSREYLPLYLKELEFRYNNRNSDIFDPAASYLCDLVPKRDSLPFFKRQDS